MRLSVKSVGLIVCLLGGVGWLERAGASEAFALQSMREHWSVSQRSSASEPSQRYIVQLDSEPVAWFLHQDDDLSAPDGKGSPLFSAASQHYRQRLVREADRFERALTNSRLDLKVKHRFTSLFNGVVLEGHQIDVAQVAAMPWVRAVFPERLFYTNLDTSLEVIDAPGAWRRVGGRDGAGAGVRVAIIDSGIRPEHPMFSSVGFTAPETGMPSDDYCSEQDASFCNGKLIVARWYMPSMSIWQDEHRSPLGFNGHGTHVAAIAVGNRVEVEHKGNRFTLSGVAPGAYLMVYKALFSPAYDPTRAMGSNITLLQALEDAVNDGADVINNSWGGGTGLDPAFSPFHEALIAAEAAGVVVVSAAGNAGPEPGTISCPGCVAAGLAVANTTHGRYLGKVLSLGNLPDLYALEGTSSIRLNQDLSAPLVAADQVDPANGKGCRPFAQDSFRGSIALVQRGDCPFLDKSEHVRLAGAKALVVDNHQSGEPFGMLMDKARIPAVMVDQASGALLRAALLKGSTALTTISATERPVVSESLVDMVHASSSRGPNGDPNILKPDIAAPGSLILSAVSSQEPGYEGQAVAMLTGTSMASPHVAGAAAVLKNLHPNWGAQAIKSALTSSAQTEGLRLPNSTSSPTPFDVGAGRLDLAAAAAAKLTFSATGFSDATCILQCQFSTRVTNRSSGKGTWVVSTELEGAEVTTQPTQLVLASGESAELVVTVDSTLAKKGQWLFGRVELTAADSHAHLPIAVFPDISDDLNLTAIYSAEPEHQLGEQAQYHAVLFNRAFNGPVTVTLDIDDALSIEPDSIETQLLGGLEQEVTVDDQRRRLVWQGRLDQTIASITEVPPLAQNSLASEANRIPCFGSCDEVSLVYTTTLPFEFHGRSYNQFTVSSNGFLSPGETKANSSWLNHRLPDSLVPNNVIAPFWTDLDLQDEDALTGDGSGGGTLHLYQVKDAAGEVNYLVVDWVGTQLAGQGDGEGYSFGVWLGVGPQKGHNLLRYYKLGPLPANLTVGVEDVLGAAGVMRYHNGEGVAPKEGDTLKVEMIPAGQLAIDFSLSSVLPEAISVTTKEDNPVSVKLLPSGSHPLVMTAENQENRVEAVRLVDFGIDEGVSVRVLNAPDAGIVQPQGSSIVYQPEADFSGQDRVRYELLDGGGNALFQQQLVIDVTQVNDAPRINMPLSYQVRGGEQLEVGLRASDVEGDPIQWQVTQRQGTAVDTEIVGSTMIVMAPTVQQAETVVLALVASDPQVSSQPVMLNIKIWPVEGEEESGGGVMSGVVLAILLWLLASRGWCYRRRAH
ncbi:S8 family serine peptidase [Ferrimonas balearica]|uniref:S8 family serine peptidase n=1 Tax=Ferrimonas balearica TaxID=44012 RepID=UPI001C98B744|nr:S8 family serine peptidase [Ferrimonas balearica]